MSKVWEDLIHLIKKKKIAFIAGEEFEKNVLIKISKSRESISTCIWLNNYFAQLKTNLFYNLISKCSNDLLYIEFAELVTYNWKKSQNKLLLKSISILSKLRNALEGFCSTDVMRI